MALVVTPSETGTKGSAAAAAAATATASSTASSTGTGTGTMELDEHPSGLLADTDLLVLVVKTTDSLITTASSRTDSDTNKRSLSLMESEGGCESESEIECDNNKIAKKARLASSSTAEIKDAELEKETLKGKRRVRFLPADQASNSSTCTTASTSIAHGNTTLAQTLFLKHQQELKQKQQLPQKSTLLTTSTSTGPKVAADFPPVATQIQYFDVDYNKEDLWWTPHEAQTHWTRCTSLLQFYATTCTDLVDAILMVWVNCAEQALQDGQYCMTLEQRQMLADKIAASPVRGLEKELAAELMSEQRHKTIAGLLHLQELCRNNHQMEASHRDDAMAAASQAYSQTAAYFAQTIARADAAQVRELQKAAEDENDIMDTEMDTEMEMDTAASEAAATETVGSESMAATAAVTA